MIADGNIQVDERADEDGEQQQAQHSVIHGDVSTMV
jgi:hypothetical protein